MTDNNIVQLKVLDTLVQKTTKRSLMTNVRMRFFQLWNSGEAKARATFHKLMASTSNGDDSVNKSRVYDRCEAVNMIIAVAKEAKDAIVTDAKPGDILRCLAVIMRQNEMGLKLRRQQYKSLMHSPSATPAE